MKIFNVVIITLFLTYSCQSQTREVDNLKPMYGGVEKTQAHIKSDKIFIKECIEQFGTIDSSVNHYIDHAWRYYYNNSLESAMKRFNQVWLLNPDYPDSYFGFASLLESQGMQIDAEEYYKLGLEKDVNHDRAIICYQRIADCKEQLQDISGTIKAYLKLTESNPDHSVAFKKLGYLQMQTGLSKEALESYNRAIQLDPDDAVTHNNRAYLNQTQKQYQAANRDYSKAIELNPNYISALVNRGMLEMQLGQFNKAKLDFERCVKLDSSAGELRSFLGLAKLNLNENDAACEDFELALKLGDKSVINLIKDNCN